MSLSTYTGKSGHRASNLSKWLSIPWFKKVSEKHSSLKTVLSQLRDITESTTIHLELRHLTVSETGKILVQLRTKKFQLVDLSGRGPSTLALFILKFHLPGVN